MLINGTSFSYAVMPRVPCGFISIVYTMLMLHSNFVEIVCRTKRICKEQCTRLNGRQSHHKKIRCYFVHYTRTWHSTHILVQCLWRELLLLKVNVVLLTITIFFEAEIMKKCTSAVHNEHVFDLQLKL